MRSTDGAPGAKRRPYREAAHYYKARPPYSAALRPALAEKLGWTGAGRLLDIGCGPGIVALELAPSFSQVIGLDPEETARACRETGLDRCRSPTGHRLRARNRRA